MFNDEIPMIQRAGMKKCTRRMRGYAKGGKLRDPVCRLELDLDGIRERKARKRGLPPSRRISHLVRVCLIHPSARHFRPFSPPSVLPSTHPFNPFFSFFDVGSFVLRDICFNDGRSFVSTTGYITA